MTGKFMNVSLEIAYPFTKFVKLDIQTKLYKDLYYCANYFKYPLWKKFIRNSAIEHSFMCSFLLGKPYSSDYLT